MPAVSKKRILSPKQLQQPNFIAGQLGEDHARNFLKERGFLILDHNWRTGRGRGGGGEIDLICLDDAELVFVEVKTRRSDDFGGPAAAVNQVKVKQLIRAATAWHRDHPQYQNHSYRFDAVSVVLSSDDGPPEITHYQNITWGY